MNYTSSIYIPEQSAVACSYLLRAETKVERNTSSAINRIVMLIKIELK